MFHLSTEPDVSIRPGWFWRAKENDEARSVENPVDLYFKSVGRNSLLPLNVPPNTDGLLCKTDATRLAEYRAKLDEIFWIILAAGREATAGNIRRGKRSHAPRSALDGDFNS